MREQFRVLKPRGVCRVVVPDLERLCRDYLTQLQNAESDPKQILNYRWSVLFLLDQLVREDCGGEMLPALREKRFDPEFIRSRIGDEAADFLEPVPGKPPAQGATLLSLIQPIKKQLKRMLGRDARGRGEAHRWMYDRLSLRLLLTDIGFVDFRVASHVESAIPDWDRYCLDTGRDGTGPRKPDSLFVEALKSQ